MLSDGAFNTKLILNTIASKRYIPIIRRSLKSLRGFGSLIVESRDRVKTRRELTKTRIIVYSLKI